MHIILIILFFIMAGCNHAEQSSEDIKVHNEDEQYINTQCGVMGMDLISTAKHKIAECLKEKDARAGEIEFYSEKNEVHWRYSQNVSANWLIPQMNNQFDPHNGIMPAMNKEPIKIISHFPGSDSALIMTENYAWNIHNVNASTDQWWVERIK